MTDSNEKNRKKIANILTILKNKILESEITFYESKFPDELWDSCVSFKTNNGIKMKVEYPTEFNTRINNLNMCNRVMNNI